MYATGTDTLCWTNCKPRSWLFAASLTLGAALAGGFGRIMERYLKDAIEALEYFAKQDAQAMQYSLIAKSLLSTCINHIQQRELDERLARVKASSDLFGLQIGTYQHLPRANAEGAQGQDQTANAASSSGHETDASFLLNGFATPEWEDCDLGTFGDLPSDANRDIFGTLNLFPMFDNF